MEEAVFSSLDTESGSLGAALGTAAGMAASFRAELSHLSRGLTTTGQSAGRLERGLSRGLQRAFTDLVVDGDGLSDVLEGLGRSMIRNTYNAALRPVADQAGSALASGLSGLVGRDPALCGWGGVLGWARCSLCPWWRCEWSHSFPHARWCWPDGRSGARGDHAPGAWRGWGAWRAVFGRRCANRGDEYYHPRCGRFCPRARDRSPVR